MEKKPSPRKSVFLSARRSGQTDTPRTLATRSILKRFPPGCISYLTWFFFFFSQKSNSVSRLRIYTGKSELYFISLKMYKFKPSLAHRFVKILYLLPNGGSKSL